MHRAIPPAAAAAPVAARPTARRRTRPARSAAVRRQRGADVRAGGASARSVARPLLSIAPQAVFTVRASGRVGLWNPAAVALTGRRRDQVLSTGLGGLFRDPTELPRLLVDVNRQGRVTRDEVLLARGGGEDVPVRVFAARLHAPRRPDGPGARPRDPDRCLVVLHDLSEVHRIRRRLIETEKLSAMAKIAGSVAHEFRNPLNSLFLATDLLEDELAGAGAVSKTIAPTLAAIREEIDRLNGVITHYLALSKIATTRLEPLDLGQRVRDFAEEWQARAGARGVALRTRIPAGRHGVAADPNQLRRVLVNLVENAFDALRGEVGDVPRASTQRPGVVTLALRPTRRWITLTVEDDGPGVPPHLRDRVFEAFYTSKPSGSGLGLYLVREIVLAHGGQVSLGETPGGGTTVAIRWPRARTAEGGAS